MHLIQKLTAAVCAPKGEPAGENSKREVQKAGAIGKNAAAKAPQGAAVGSAGGNTAHGSWDAAARRSYRKNCLLAAALAACAVAAVYAVLGWWPFGGGTLLTGDLNGQYVAFIADLWRRVRQGGFFYSFGKLAGGSTLGMFAYYTNSPFNLVYLALPVRMIPQATQIIFLLRTALTAAAFCHYLSRRLRSVSPLMAVLSLGYALCAFCMAYSQNVIWMDVVWLLPLLLAALDELAATGRHWRFTLLLLAAILLNFYTAWAVCLFCLLYFVCLCAAAQPGGLPRARRFLLFLASGLLAAGLALVFLVPVLWEVQQSKGALLEFTFSFAPQFSLLELPYRLFFGSFLWQDVTNGLPNIYCGAAVAALALLWFFGASPRREKLAYGGLLAALVLSFWIKGFDLVWHGFKQPVWFPYRYSFVFSVVLLLLAARALTEKPPKNSAFLAVLAVCVIWAAGYRAVIPAEEFSLPKQLVSVLCCAAALGFAFVRQRGSLRPLLRRAAALGFAVVLAGELTANAVLTLRKFESYSVSEFTDFYDAASASLAQIQGQNAAPARVEKNFMHTLNDPMLLGYWGISHYSSTKASAAKEMLEQLGYIGYSTYGWGSTGVADSLLGIRWLYSDGSRPVPGHYTALPEAAGAFAVYQNENAFPLAYLVSSEALKVDAALGSENTFALQNALLSAMVPGTPDALEKAQVGFSTTESGTLEVKFRAPCTGACYLAIPGTDNLLPIDVVKNSELYAQYFEEESLGGVLPLGRLEQGEQITLELGFLDKPEYRSQVQLYCLNESVLESAAQTVRANAPAESEVSICEGGRIDLVAAAGENSDLLVLPFAWDENWRAAVNGKAAAVEPLLGGLMAVRLPQGETVSVSLRYHHPGVWQGALGSAAALILALLWRRREKRAARRA